MFKGECIKRKKKLLKASASEVAELCEDGLGVSPDRCYLHVVDVPRSDFGFKGDTFA